MKKIWNHILSILQLETGFKFSLRTLFLMTLVVYSGYIVFMFGQRRLVDVMVALLICIVGLLLIGYASIYLFDLIKKIPSSVIFYLGTVMVMLHIMFDSSKTEHLEIIFFSAIVTCFLSLGYLLYRFMKKIDKPWYVVWSCRILFVLSGVVLAMIIFWEGIEEDYENAFLTYKADFEISETGSIYDVQTGSYGKGKFLEEYTVNSHESVTTSIGHFLGKWNKAREKQVGFNVFDVPLNGLYYMPKEEGEYPLVLVVHGNHEMTHNSENGYGYLGEYLASRGYIVVSVDENFLNYSTFNSELLGESLGNENDARAYVLLEHVEYLLSQNEKEASPFYQMIDSENIALIGHSRGGEAVAIARYYDEINYLPNDFHMRFNYDFDIKSIVAIAPTDQQYKPSNRKVDLTDVNYLLLHGAQDMDVTYFAGVNQYERIKLTEDSSAFKTSVYIYGANHGQFNESWSKSDTASMSGLFYNTDQLMDREKQEQIASQLIYNFLEASLKENVNYRDGFKNIKSFVDLPETLYQTQYYDGKCEDIVNYNEDSYLETGINSMLSSSGLNKWYEGHMRLDGRKSDVYGAYIGWNSSEASYNIEMHDIIELEEEDTLYLTIGDDSEENDDLIDFDVLLEDENGEVSKVPISEYGMLQHTIQINISKFYFVEDINNRETLLQTYQLPVKWFVDNNNALTIDRIKKISLVFYDGDDHIIFLKELGVRHHD